MKKQYITPKIKAVELDPKQAILQTCRVAATAIYFTVATNRCNYGAGPGPSTATCNTPIKGKSSITGVRTTFVYETDTIPS